MAEVLDALRAAHHVVLTTHVNADGDGVGSQVALAAWLKAVGTHVSIVNPTPFPESFDFLLSDPSWLSPVDEPEAAELCRKADLAVVMDTGEVPRIGRVNPLISHLDTVVVDHHPMGDRPIGGVSFRDSTACATGELVYDLIQGARGPWPREALEGIYVAILTDTGSFRFSNSTPASHLIAANLIEMGIDVEDIYRRIWGSAPLRRYELLRVCLESLQVDPEDGAVAWMVVPREVVQRMEARPEDLEGLVDYPRSVEGAEVGLLFRQTNNGGTKISLRSNGQVDVNALARDFGGGGHARASGAMVNEPPHKVVPRVVSAAREAVRRTREG